ncbi:MAG: FecR domain-containing protein [Gemmatimonadota bacterium]
MTTPVPPQSGPLTTEDALKDAFLAHHAALAAKAREKLGADAVALAPKVVEGAFVRAWDARARFKTASELDAFLADDVHHASARALSRRAAAHRFAGNATSDAHHATSGEINADESWTHIQHALHGEEHSAGTLAAVAKASRHEAAGHIAGVGKSRGAAIAIGIGVVAIAAVLGLMSMMNRMAEKGKVARALNASDVRLVNTPMGRKGEISLADGSTAHVAPDSKLTIPKDFGPELRGVKIEGAATFDVWPNIPVEFQVYARNVVVAAKGTSFTVNAYPDDKAVIVVVAEGSVEVRQGDVMQTVAAGAGLVIPDSGAARVATEDERNVGAGWRTGMLALTDRPLRDALKAMKRWYGYEVSVPEVALLERRVTMKASLDSALQAVHQIAKSGGLKFGYVGQNMAFIDSADKKTNLR